MILEQLLVPDPNLSGELELLVIRIDHAGSLGRLGWCRASPTLAPAEDESAGKFAPPKMKTPVTKIRIPATDKTINVPSLDGGETGRAGLILAAAARSYL